MQDQSVSLRVSCARVDPLNRLEIQGKFKKSRKKLVSGLHRTVQTTLPLSGLLRLSAKEICAFLRGLWVEAIIHSGGG